MTWEAIVKLTIEAPGGCVRGQVCADIIGSSIRTAKHDRKGRVRSDYHVLGTSLAIQERGCVRVRTIDFAPLRTNGKGSTFVA